MITYSVISTSQAKSAKEPVVESMITYIINTQPKPLTVRDFWSF